ncbi:MAG: alkaline phosphatase family protein [SAR324 cluster bacterium]|nr:alkaline phosphatase family protein [SAR324 cluster bacterium]
MEPIRNILFIMCDQLRADYLGCYGHPNIRTPNIDQLASKGMLFTCAYTQAPMCGPARMSFYTGQYVMSHGSIANMVPLSVGVHNIGDYLRPEGMEVALVGKTHMAADWEGMQRVGLSPNSPMGRPIVQCGFDPVVRDDGLHPDQSLDSNLAYNQYLNDLGYSGKNPWHDYANSAEGLGGEILSGWYLRHSSLPARIEEEYSETPYMTDKAIQYIAENAEKGDQPWCLHLSYIKPHWPYMAPAPYHNMYSSDSVIPVNASHQETINPHPVYQAFRDEDASRTFRRQEVRKTVIPTYMGLISQIDHHLGRLFQFLEQQGRMKDTMIVFTSDHGDYLGDHGLGEKQLFHEESVRIPLIVHDPRPQADVTRGTQSSELVEAIDLLPTFIEAVGGHVKTQRLEGKSFLPLLHNQKPAWREFVLSEADYSFYQVRKKLNISPHQARAYMVRSKEWKYIFYENYPPQLFDLKNDCYEHNDLGQDSAYASVREMMSQQLFIFFRNRQSAVTISEEDILKKAGKAKERGFLTGVW